MAEGRKPDDALEKSLAHLKKRALDVKFDLDTTEYVPQENIGIGAYGVVCSAVHKKTNDRVAIKKIPSVFDVKEVAKRTYREIKILKHFKHDNIIHIREILKPKGSLSDFRDVYVVFDLMESDLHRIIYSKQELTEEHVRYFLYQILRGLKYIHSAHVVHRDLKPSNLLVNEDCQLRVGDFGMSRGVSSSPQEPNYFMTQYVATRWYRAPEIMLSLVEYGTAVDMWSVGCIFAEMLGRKPLFPGKDYISQIRLIVGMVGSPKDDLLQLCHSPIIKNYFRELGHKDPVPWPKLFPNASKKAINLLSRMLVLHPKERLTVEQALVHPYLNKYHDPDDEPICVPVFNFDFEKEDMSISEIRDAIHKEAMEYHQPRTPTLSFNAFLRPVPKSPEDKPSSSGIPFLPKRETSLSDSNIAQQSSETKQEQGQPVPVLKTGDGEVFKKPLSAKNDDDTQVKIDTNSSLKVESEDVEMLSAKSTAAKQPDIAEEKPKENREPERGNKQTISQDTKALVKAALLNSNLRKQRLDSVGDDEKPKPMTAAMRQKEREEKRKKKKKKSAEKRQERLKKGKEKEELLTSADKELLTRWVKMQKVNVPIAPKPGVSINSETFLVGPKSIQSELNGKSGVFINSVPATGTMKADSMGSGGQIFRGQGHVEGGEIVATEGHVNSKITQMFGRTVHKGPAAQQETLNLLQQHLRSQGQGEPGIKVQGQISATVNDSAIRSVQPKNQIMNNINPASSVGVSVDESLSPLRSDSLTEPKSSSFSVDFSNVSLGDLDFLTMLSTPTSVSEMDSLLVDSNSNYTSVTSINESGTVPKIEVVSEVNHIMDQSSGGYLQKLCSENVSPQMFPRDTGSHNIPQQTYSQNVSPSHVSSNSQSPVEQNLIVNRSPQNLSPNHLQYSPDGSYSVSQQDIGQRHSPDMGRNVSTNHVSPNLSCQQDNASVNFGSGSNQPFSQAVNPDAFGTAKTLMSFGRSECNSVNTTFQPSNFATGTGINTNSLQPHTHQGFGHSSQINPQINSHNTKPFASYSQQSLVEGESTAGVKPGLFVNTKQAQMPFRQLFQDAMPGPSGSQTYGNQLQNPHLDLVALAKQLSKSNMEDICPPLTLTPKGTGGGYGVGVDVDSLMVISQDGESTLPEPSPLSSSILADWMEVTGNMNIDIDALEQELQSPMALSYNDLNLYSS